MSIEVLLIAVILLLALVVLVCIGVIYRMGQGPSVLSPVLDQRFIAIEAAISRSDRSNLAVLHTKYLSSAASIIGM